jgi:hypothetical protein
MVRKKDLTLEQIKRMRSGLTQCIKSMVEDFQTETGILVDIEKENIPTVGSAACDWPFEIRITGRF